MKIYKASKLSGSTSKIFPHQIIIGESSVTIESSGFTKAEVTEMKQFILSKI